MIKNERQYKITRAKADEIRVELADAERTPLASFRWFANTVRASGNTPSALGAHGEARGCAAESRWARDSRFGVRRAWSRWTELRVGNR